MDAMGLDLELTQQTVHRPQMRKTQLQCLKTILSGIVLLLWLSRHKCDVKGEVNSEVNNEVNNEVNIEVKSEVKKVAKNVTQNIEVKSEVKSDVTENPALC